MKKGQKLPAAAGKKKKGQKNKKINKRAKKNSLRLKNKKVLVYLIKKRAKKRYRQRRCI
jgi:hypothetical protein